MNVNKAVIHFLAGLTVGKSVLFKSFICFRGHDSNQRFTAVVATTYILLVALSSVMSASLALIFGLALVALAGFSGLRRLNDSHGSIVLIGLVLVPLFSFLLLLMLEAGIGYLIVNLIIAAIQTALLAIRPAALIRDYQYGYDGPANESIAAVNIQRQRVEPTILHGQSSGEASMDWHDTAQLDAEDAQPEAESNRPNFQGFSQSLPLWVHQAVALQQKIVAANFSVLALMWLILLWPASTVDEPLSEAETELEQSQPLIPQPQALTAQATLPDGLGLRLQGKVLILRWLGEEGSPQQLWSQATAEGDKSCAHAEFNNGSRYRPIDVVLTADSAIEARFSPLDTQAVVKDVAMRGNIKLCGYRFSLKGSQAALTKVKEFARYVE